MKKLDVVYTKENEVLDDEIAGFLKSQGNRGFSLWAPQLKVSILDRINEFSTQHFDEDSYRIRKGD